MKTGFRREVFAAIAAAAIFPFTSNQAQGQVLKAWNPNYTKPCECSATLEEAIPALFANRLAKQKEARFIDIQTDLIRGFTESDEIPNEEKVILWSVYQLGSYDIANALIEAHEAGVDVRVLTDGKSVTVDPAKRGREENPSGGAAWQRDIYRILKKAGVKVSHSNPDWKPVGNPYPRIMHEKIRIFGVKSGRVVKPLFAYVSTHNDTYSEMLGDPVNGLPLKRLRQGNLGRDEIQPGSNGNVQLSFILRHRDALNMLYQNYAEQEKIYGQGVGRIQDLQRREPRNFKLDDGSQIKLSFTYGKRSSYNPNQAQAEFYQELGKGQGLKAERIDLQQFVFTYSKVENALEELAAQQGTQIEAIVDARAAYQAYTQARAMAGLYSVMTYRPSSPIAYPWKKDFRRTVKVKSYSNHADRLHTKNSLVTYRNEKGELRYRIFTGSLNLSSNGATNKEIAIEIDTASTQFTEVMNEQRKTIEASGDLRALNEAALFNRLTGTAKAFGAPVISFDKKNELSFERFLSALTNGSNLLASPLLLGASSETFARPRWLSALKRFYDEVGAEDVSDDIVADIEDNLNDTDRFWNGISSVEVFMVLSESKDDLDPAIRNAVLGLFSDEERSKN